MRPSNSRFPVSLLLTNPNVYPGFTSMTALPNTVAVMLCAMFAASGCAQKGFGLPSLLSHPAPDFSLPSVDGRQISLAQLHGKVVVLDFWATWCTPCRQALPHLQALAANADMARKGLVVLAIDEREQPATIRPFLDQNHYTFTVIQDTNASAERAYDPPEFPTTIVIGRDGLVRSVISGWTQDTPHLIDAAVTDALDANK
jgi:thiol-disulfide isomerase/thioredoxin